MILFNQFFDMSKNKDPAASKSRKFGHNNALSGTRGKDDEGRCPALPEMGQGRGNGFLLIVSQFEHEAMLAQTSQIGSLM